MALSPLEVSNFVGGLVTDANPMSFPPNASLDEYNMLLNQDGTRSRRLGIDIEANGTPIAVADVVADFSTISYRAFKWDNVAGVPDLTFIVVQIGSYIAIFDSANEDLTSVPPIFTHTLDNKPTQVGFAHVDGILVIASGAKDLMYIEFNPANATFISNGYRLKIRDTFGVEDIDGGINYREGSNIAKRPYSLTDAHIYNLRNQTWALPRLIGGLNAFAISYEVVLDPIQAWFELSQKSYPSNADSVLDSLYPNTASMIDPVTNRFNPKELQSNPPGSLSAPRGYFVIDALDRGTSRLAEITKLYDDKPPLRGIWKVEDLPLDSTPTGPTCLAQFAGRMFYAGFTSEVIDGDAYSPHMGSYVLFSKLVENTTDLPLCHQVGDPTSKNYAELLDTDGGFIRLEGAYNVQGMIPLPSGLAVIAENGVWVISGEDRGQFKATSYSTSKLSPNGCDSPGSIIPTGDGFMFWSRDGIYKAAPNQFGDMIVSNMTKNKIQKFYDAISQEDRRYVVGTIDKYERKVKWVYSNRLNANTACRELIYSFDFDAFTSHRISQGNYDDGVNEYNIIVAAPVTMPSFYALRDPSLVLCLTDQVLCDGEDVFVSSYETAETLTETKYLTILTYANGAVSYTFSSYSEPYHYDWTVASGTGIDAEACMLTGWFGGGDYQRNKQLPYLTMHFYKTETHFVDVDDDFVLQNQSSCLIQAQWNWANHVNSGKWGTTFQGYRLTRHWIPPTVDSLYDNGFYTVETRNKVRGSGKVLSLKFTSEPGKHMDIIGWSLLMEARNNV